MKIGVNLLFMNHTANHGVVRHTEALLEGFRKIDRLKDCCLFVRELYYEKAKERFGEATIICIKAKGIINWILNHIHTYHNYYECRYLNHTPLAVAVKQQHVNIMLHPFNDSTICFIEGIPNIMVIHDLYYLRYPQYYGYFRYFYAKYKHAYFLKKANSIITVSEFVKDDILKNLKLAKDMFIQVIPNAVVPARLFTEFVPIDPPYILAIAPHTYEKNLITLLKAFYLIRKRIPHELVILGKHEEETINLHEYIKSHELTERVLCLEGVPDEHRNSLYRHTSLLVVPSLTENFGRVPIEGALLQIPVLTSSASALMEVTQGLLNYYDPPTDSHARAMKMISLLKQPPPKEQLESIASIYTHLYDETAVAKRFESIFEGIPNC